MFLQRTSTNCGVADFNLRAGNGPNDWWDKLERILSEAVSDRKETNCVHRMVQKN